MALGPRSAAPLRKDERRRGIYRLMARLGLLVLLGCLGALVSIPSLAYTGAFTIERARAPSSRSPSSATWCSVYCGGCGDGGGRLCR